MSAPRIFTVAEAERALPLVRRVVHDLMAEYPSWREAVSRYELLTSGVRADRGEDDELRQTREEVGARAERINGFLGEMEQIGCVFKGFEAGLVDFYSLRDDHLVFLCWKVDEDRITHWHEINTGFSGRQPIDAQVLMGTES
jgi:hypothetical protein